MRHWVSQLNNFYDFRFDDLIFDLIDDDIRWTGLEILYHKLLKGLPVVILDSCLKWLSDRHLYVLLPLPLVSRKVIKESTKLCYKNNHSKIAEEFNTYFTSVGRLTADRVKELAEENGVLIPPPGPSTIPNYITPEEMFQLRSVTPNEIQRIILETPSHKAPGPDKIGFRYLKDSLDVILYPLTDIINCSLRS